MQHTDVIDKWKVPIIESNKFIQKTFIYTRSLFHVQSHIPGYTDFLSNVLHTHLFFSTNTVFFNILQYPIKGLIQHWVIFFYLFSPSQYLDLSRHYSCQNTFWDPGHNIQTQALVSFHYEEHHVACIIWKKRRTKFG